MKKLTIFWLMITAVMLVSLKPHIDGRNSSQAPLGRTGAPNESTCGSCHGGGSYTGEIIFQLNGDEQTEYEPGVTYTITFESDFNAPRHGFSVTVLDGDNEPTGDFALTNEDNTSLGTGGNGRQYVGHKSADGNNEWSFEWTAPGSDVGDITFYYVINAANGDGGTGGDYIETGTTTISPTEQPDVFTLTLLAEPENGGQPTGGGEYEEGEVIPLSAAPNEGYEFVQWTDADGNEVSDQEDFEFSMPGEDVTLIAHYSFSTFSLSFHIENEAGEAIDDASILFDGDQYEAGQYLFDGLAPGTYEYVVSRDGYFNQEGSVTILDEDKELTIVLVEDDTSAPGPEVPQISVYPNPASSLLHVRSDKDTIQEVRLLDMLGNVVYRETVKANNHAIRLADYRRGIYFVQVYTHDRVLTYRVQITG